MNITVFTSNQPRHLSLINDLAGIADTVFAVIEVKTIFPGEKSDFYKKSEVMQKYFSKVIESEKRIFGDISFLSKNVRPLIIKSGDLNNVSMNILEPALNSYNYVVFGSSYIKGELVDFLVPKGTYNIHMGVSPYYRGSSCNFWAAYDGNLDMVGATIHMLTKGLDSGPMLFHALPKATINPFDLGMLAVKSAHIGLVRKMASGEIEKFEPIPQDKSLEIRYARYADFTDDVAMKYLENLPGEVDISTTLSDLNKKKYLNPFIY